MRLRLILLLSTALLLAGLTPAQAAPSRPRGPRLAHHTTVPQLPGRGADATLAIRDLLLQKNAITTSPPGNDFARPVEDSYSCFDDIKVCLHWNVKDYSGTPGCTFTAIGQQQIPADPCWLSEVGNVVHSVAATYVQAGYRSPKPDNGTEDASIAGDSVPQPNGSQHRFYTDIYLANTGAQGKYGYCSVDATSGPTGMQLVNQPPGKAGDVPAFCVLDDDFAEFGARSTPIQALQVTVAHEFFHAVQFSYDFFEDRWFMEATAVWAEDQLYTDINDNLQYLPYSQLRTPRLSLDRDDGNGGFLHYGDWVFIRYLTEHIPETIGPLPGLVLQMWQNADSLGADSYSIQAIAAAVALHGLDFDQVFAQYADALHHPALSWSEGAANRYPAAPVATSVTLRPRTTTRSGTLKVDHLASATVRVTPKRLSAPRFKLRLRVQMAKRRLGSAAVMSVYYANGSVGTRTLRLDARGRGQTKASFSSRTVRYVELTLANASHRYRCWSSTVYSCQGTPLDDGVAERWTVTALR